LGDLHCGERWLVLVLGELIPELLRRAAQQLVDRPAEPVLDDATAVLYGFLEGPVLTNERLDDQGLPLRRPIAKCEDDWFSVPERLEPLQHGAPTGQRL
jgi:hypothetical protein